MDEEKKFFKHPLMSAATAGSIIVDIQTSNLISQLKTCQAEAFVFHSLHRLRCLEIFGILKITKRGCHGSKENK